VADPTPTQPDPTRDPARRDRHSQALARLLAEREDLQGVHPLADLVSDSLRWSA